MRHAPAAIAAALAVATLPPAAQAHDRHPPAARFVFSPYKDVTLSLDGATHEIASAVSGTPSPLIVNGRSALPAGVNALTWAFAVGECGEETWMGIDARKFAAANVPAFNAAGIDYIVARYGSPQLIGLDFDIEGPQTQDQIDSLMQRIRTASEKHPQLRMSFTIATLAASDGSRGSLNATGERVLASLRRHGPKDYVINLMVMDYGPARPGAAGRAQRVAQVRRAAVAHGADADDRRERRVGERVHARRCQDAGGPGAQAPHGGAALLVARPRHTVRRRHERRVADLPFAA
jgi:chitinase